MRQAVTDRMGPDESPLMLRIERTAWDRVPPMGYPVCAIGQDGWKYIGNVIARDDDAGTYTIAPKASNPIARRLPC